VNSLDILAEIVRDPRNSGNINAGMRDGRTCLHIAADKNRLVKHYWILLRKQDFLNAFLSYPACHTYMVIFGAKTQ